MLFSINSVPGVEFESSEAIEWAWGAVPRRSRLREVPYRPGELSFVESGVEAIDASVYSLPSSFLGASEASAFLATIRELAPARRVVALVDLPLRSELQPALLHGPEQIADSLCRSLSHPAQYVSGIPSPVILLSISHPIRCSTRCLANVRARISGPMIAL